MRAIVYTSNTGSTAKYAKMLSHQIVVPAYSIKEAEKKVKPGAEIIYLGWIMAGKIKGYAEAARKYKVQAVCGVGMGQTGTQLAEVRTKNKVPQSIPLFTLQGTFDINKLHGIYKMMMNIMVKTAGKALADKTDRTPEDDDMLDMMMNGSERVKTENLRYVIEWYDTVK
ncbi:MAG: flavodoxin domain-containing protein [Anaerostipes sp.]|nr:flavodoxin domain-containing protein [Anaerostipes sp.]